MCPVGFAHVMSTLPPTDSALGLAFSALPEIDVDTMAAQAADLASRLGTDTGEPGPKQADKSTRATEVSAKERKRAAWKEKQKLWAQKQQGSKKAPIPRQDVKLPVVAQERAGGVPLTNTEGPLGALPPPGAEVLSSAEIEEINTITSTLSDTVSDLSSELARTREEVELLKKSNTSLQISLTSLNRDVASLTAAVLELGAHTPKLPAKQLTRTTDPLAKDKRSSSKVTIQAPPADSKAQNKTTQTEVKSKILQEEIE